MKENTKRRWTTIILLTIILICFLSLLWPGIPFGHDFLFIYPASIPSVKECDRDIFF